MTSKQEQHCKKGYTWNGTECVFAFQPAIETWEYYQGWCSDGTGTPPNWGPPVLWPGGCACKCQSNLDNITDWIPLPTEGDWMYGPADCMNLGDYDDNCGAGSTGMGCTEYCEDYYDPDVGTTTRKHRAEITDGLTLAWDGSGAVLVDSDFNIQHSWPNLPSSNYNSNVFPDLSILVDGNGGMQNLTIYDDSGNQVWNINFGDWATIQQPDKCLRRHHDTNIMPNGNVLIHGSHFMTYEYAQSLGRVQFGDGVNNGNFPADVGSDTQCQQIMFESAFVMEIEPIGSNDAQILWEWYAEDYFIQDTDGGLPGYVPTSDMYLYPNNIDINIPAYVDNSLQWTHTNTAHYDPSRDSVILSLRHWDGGEHLIIQRDGSYGGDIIFRCCNPANYHRGNPGGNPEYWDGDPSDRLSYLMHGANIIPENYVNGGDMIWLNNEHVSGGFFDASAVIKITPDYNIDMDGIEPWQYTAEILTDIDGTTYVATNKGGAFGLSNGNVLWSLTASALEVENPFTDAVLAWEIDNSSGFSVENRPIKYMLGCTDITATNYNTAAGYGYMIDDGSCEDNCPLGDLNGDGGINVLDIVRLANIVLDGECYPNWTASEYECCTGDINGDGGHNVLDIVALVNLVLGTGRAGATPDIYAAPEGMTDAEQDRILLEIINGTQDIHSIKRVLDREVPQHIIKGSGRTTPPQNNNEKQQLINSILGKQNGGK